ncbi:MAG TPA: FHA domain-containing protein [Chloroflexota bacterium]|nr:FHA domain-containing protein [Chloroflexota bacterium]
MSWRVAAVVLALVVGIGWGLGARTTDVARAQQAPVEIFLTQFNYDPPTGTYYVLVSISDPSRVGDLDPRLLDLQTGENVRFGDTVPVTGAEMDFHLPTDQLLQGRKYRLAIRAFQPGTTTYLRRPTQNPSEDPLVFASQEFTYNPPQLAPVAFSVDGVSADFPRHVLRIAVNHSDTQKPLRYEAVIVDKLGGVVGRVAQTNLVDQNGIVEAPLPVAMERTDDAAEYHLTFRLYTADNNKLVGEQKKDFILPAPPNPNIVERLTIALGEYPWLRWSIAGIAAVLVIAYLVRAFWPRKRKPMPRPQNLEPVYLRPAPVAAVPAAPEPAVAPSEASIRAEAPTVDVAPASRVPLTVAVDEGTAVLVVTTEPAKGQEFLLAETTATLGRAGDNTIVIADDFVSRRHAKIVRQGEQYLWSDFEGVTQPSTINGGVVSGSAALHDGDRIEVGKTGLVFRMAQTIHADNRAAAPLRARVGERSAG